MFREAICSEHLFVNTSLSRTTSTAHLLVLAERRTEQRIVFDGRELDRQLVHLMLDSQKLTFVKGTCIAKSLTISRSVMPILQPLYPLE